MAGDPAVVPKVGMGWWVTLLSPPASLPGWAQGASAAGDPNVVPGVVPRTYTGQPVTPLPSPVSSPGMAWVSGVTGDPTVIPGVAQGVAAPSSPVLTPALSRQPRSAPTSLPAPSGG